MAKFYRVRNREVEEVPRPERYDGRDVDRIVAKTTIETGTTGEIEVSTVSLTRWHESGPNEWETMVFAPDFPQIDQDEAVERHDSEANAIVGHGAMVMRVLDYLDKVS